MRDLMGMVFSPDRLVGIQQTAGNYIEMLDHLRVVCFRPRNQGTHKRRPAATGGRLAIAMQARRNLLNRAAGVVRIDQQHLDDGNLAAA